MISVFVRETSAAVGLPGWTLWLLCALVLVGAILLTVVVQRRGDR